MYETHSRRKLKISKKDEYIAFRKKQRCYKVKCSTMYTHSDGLGLYLRCFLLI